MLQIDCIHSLIQGQRLKKKPKLGHLKPIAYAEFNTSLGKAKPKKVKALLDSGGAGSIVTEQVAKKLRLKKSKSTPVRWTTPAGEVTTNTSVKSELRLPELQSDTVIEWTFHVTPSLGAYDMIIGRDLLEFLGIDIHFSNHTIMWDSASMPFKDVDD